MGRRRIRRYGWNRRQAFEVDGCNGTTSAQHHNAVIKNIAHESGYGIIQSNCGGSSFSNDYFAFVGNIVVNANAWTGGSGTCGGAVDANAPKNFDANSGTHIFLHGNFIFGNLGPTPVTDCTSDMEPVNMDRFDRLIYTAQTVESDDLIWENAGYGLQLNNSTSNATTQTFIIDHNTRFADCQNYVSGASNCSELNIAYNSAQWNVTITNNLARTTTAACCGGTGAYWAMNYDTIAASTSFPPITKVASVETNYLWGFQTGCTGTCAPNTGVNIAISCCGGSPVAPPTGIYTDPAFTNTTDLLANWVSTPNCSSYADAASCMGWNFGAQSPRSLTPIYDLTPTASGTSGIGYRPPHACASDANFPTWLKGIVYLQWNGASITENGGLVNKPCGL